MAMTHNVSACCSYRVIYFFQCYTSSGILRILHSCRELFGEENVGILTGDAAVNREAPIMVMTTEILRNMLYERCDHF
jgi:hypothetical protein